MLKNIVSLISFSVVAVLGLAGCGRDSDQPKQQTEQTVPAISLLQYTPDTSAANTATSIRWRFNLSDAGGDVSTGTYVVSNPSGIQLYAKTLNLGVPAGTNTGVQYGTTSGVTFSTPGTYTVHWYITDRAGNNSNILTKTFTITSGASSAPYYPISINYGNPTNYLNHGAQSALSDANFSEIQRQISLSSHDISAVGQVYSWMVQNFRSSPSDGATIGKVDVNTLYSTKTLSGCSDYALLMSSVLRRFGFPVVMVQAAGIQWAEQYRVDPTITYSGHAFIEVYLDGKWVLVDSTTGEYILTYDHDDPVIPIAKRVDSKSYASVERGYYVLYKGLDPADYGVTSLGILETRMRDFAENLDHMTVTYAPDVIQRF